MGRQKHKIAVLSGDGIGPEVTQQAISVLAAVSKLCGFDVISENALIGGDAIDKTGTPLPDETVMACKSSDAVLLGAVGGYKWDDLPPMLRPETGLLSIRSALGLFANLRPAIVHEALRGASPLKDEVLGDNLNILIVRELTGGIYFGERGRSGAKDGEVAYDTESYSAAEVARVGRAAFRLARERGGRLCSVDKANVLESSRLWREVITMISAEFTDVSLSHMYVDNAAMQLVRAPGQFDTIVTGNMFGDILSDEASQITGSIGMLPSASLDESGFGLYEPVHGSAPDIAGRDVANPIAAILSVAMMLRYSLGQSRAADIIEHAVESALDAGFRTADIARLEQPGTHFVGTAEMGAEILARL